MSFLVTLNFYNFLWVFKTQQLFQSTLNSLVNPLDIFYFSYVKISGLNPIERIFYSNFLLSN